jgi:Tfp pilus assembly protein PilF
MPLSVRHRRCVHATGLLLAFAASLSGCASTPKEAAQASDQKAYGAKMAQQGFWREALFRFDRAARLAPEDPEILNNVAVASEAVGETARALAAYKRALELRPDDAKIKRNYARFAEYYTSLQRASGPTATPK